MLYKPAEYISLDDLLNATYTEILRNGLDSGGKRGSAKEFLNYSATLTNPRVRTSMSLNRKLVQSKFAEFSWYLSKKDDVEYIKPYIPVYELEEQVNGKILGGYGSRIFGCEDGNQSQFERVIEQISRRNQTKQAYLVISENSDFRFRDVPFESPPCTIGLHFYVRDSKLNLTSYMRSNDAYYGLPHDLFCFTIIQEMVSLRTNIPLGKYTHISTSMHVYEQHFKMIENYLTEGKQEPIEMPKINDCCSRTLNSVSREFDMNELNSNIDSLDDYWKDFVLFSKRHLNDDVNIEQWLRKFADNDMKRIAHNSIS
jgi:thymidylate synthase